MELKLPPALVVLSRLEQSGYEAYVVGGCVRDSLMGLTPHDWDVTTSALPDQTIQALDGFRVLETGRKHGTVTVLVYGMPIEVTTYRIDGAYSDNRRPDEVHFTPSLREDLARRDFTVNALAYNPLSGLVDCFGGADDIRRRIIRCVGDPDKRFHEDALRILRGLRFASTLSFSIEDATSRAILDNRALLGAISAERISAELLKLLCGEGASAVLSEFAPVFAQTIPELAPCVGFDQHHPYHRYTVYEHLVHTVAASPPDPALRFAALLHDIGKPLTCTVDKTGICHFYGHAKQSAELARAVVHRLRMSTALADEICSLVLYHDLALTPDKPLLLRRLNKLGENRLKKLFALRRADLAGQGTDRDTAELDAAEHLLTELLTQRQCFSLRDLAVSGNDLLEAGIPPGKAVGEELRRLLSLVIDGGCPNHKDELLTHICGGAAQQQTRQTDPNCG